MLLVVADGVGLAPDGPANALSVGDTPVIDSLLASKHSTRLHAHGTHVGLPSDADMGNSEVGHNTLGGGRVFDQGAKLVAAAMENGKLFVGENWQEVERRGIKGNTVHFLGLLSDGNVHSHISHLLAMLKQCANAKIQSVAVHILLDGRDVEPRSAEKYINKLNQTLDSINQLSGFNYRVASGGGRMILTMDRYEADWEMVRKGYQIHVHGSTSIAGREVRSALEEVTRQFDEDATLSDQYLAPFVVVDDAGPVGKMRDGDAVVLFNFRGDRAIEISRAFDDPDFNVFDRGNRPEVFFCGMLQFDGNVSVQRAGGDPNLDLLFDSAEMTLFIIDHKNKSYYKIDQSVINKAASMLDSLSAVAESQEGVLSDLLGTLGIAEDDEQTKIDIVKTDTVLATAGINCQLFQQLNNGKLQSELCIAPESGLGILGEHYQTMALFYQFGDSLMSKAGNILQNIGFGLPNRSRLGEGGLPIMAYVVEDTLKVSVFNIQTDNPAKALFELPQGYIQTPIPFIG